MGFAWNNFGILARESEDEKYFYIHNDKGDWRKISKEKYASNLPNLKAKVQTLMGKPIIFRTSQNTANWSPSEWFSDIDVDESGFHNPEAIVPFSEPKFTEGVEPESESNEALKKKIEELKKKHSDEREEWNAERNKLQGELIAKDSKLSEVKYQTEDEEKRKIEADAKALLDMGLIGTEQSLKVRGHPVRELALRIGKVLPDNQRNITAKFIKHIDRNKFRVSLPQFDNVEADFAIGLKEKNMFVYSVMNTDPNYARKFKEVMGCGDESYKNRTDLSLEELAQIHFKVMGK